MRLPLCLGVFILSALKVQFGLCTGIKCYSCSSKDTEACVKPETSQLPMVKCDMKSLQTIRRQASAINERYDKLFDVDAIDASRIDLVCVKVVAKDGNKDYIVRGCQLAEQRNLDICNKLKEKDTTMIRTVHCSKCSTDGCNSAYKMTLNVFLAVATLTFRLYI